MPPITPPVTPITGDSHGSARPGGGIGGLARLIAE